MDKVEKKHQILTSNNALKETYILTYLRKVLRCKFHLTFWKLCKIHKFLSTALFQKCAMFCCSPDHNPANHRQT